MKLEPDAREAEALNPDDHALAFVTLDGCEGVACSRCDRVLHLCKCCEFCQETRCVCEPFSQAETRAMTERYDRRMPWRS